MTARLWLAMSSSLALAIAGCAGSSGPSRASADAPGITVFAASSLTGAFTEIEELYEQRNPGVAVTINFLSSSDLATQLQQGAPAHVFAAADEPNMQRVLDANLADGEPQLLAHNKLEIVVPDGNPGNVQSLEDLENGDLVLSLCAEECPAGRYAQEVLDRAGVEVQPDSLEPEVKAVVTRVQLGEADVGIVYATDVIAAGDEVEGIAIPEDDNVIATYLISVLSGAPSSAREFVDLVLSTEGQRILEGYGFLGR